MAHPARMPGKWLFYLVLKRGERNENFINDIGNDNGVCHGACH
jgi:hypothetical protein